MNSGRLDGQALNLVLRAATVIDVKGRVDPRMRFVNPKSNLNVYAAANTNPFNPTNKVLTWKLVTVASVAFMFPVAVKAVLMSK